MVTTAEPYPRWKDHAGAPTCRHCGDYIAVNFEARGRWGHPRTDDTVCRPPITECEYGGLTCPDYHSNDRVEVHTGAATPTILCGYHATQW